MPGAVVSSAASSGPASRASRAGTRTIAVPSRRATSISPAVSSNSGATVPVHRSARACRSATSISRRTAAHRSGIAASVHATPARSRRARRPASTVPTTSPRRVRNRGSATGGTSSPTGSSPKIGAIVRSSRRRGIPAVPASATSMLRSR